MDIKAFTMKLLPGKATEYKKRHDEIWPKLEEVLTEYGIYDYSIHLDEENHVLFAVHKVNAENRLDELPKNALMQKWWDYMADIMETNADNSPKITPLAPVFSLQDNKLVQ